MIDNGKGRLFCKTLLPGNARLVDMGGEKNKYLHLGQRGTEQRIQTKDGKHYGKFDPARTKPEQQFGSGRLDVVPPDETAACVYLHVLFAADTKTAKMPACSVEKKGADLVVKVGALSYTFKPGK